MEGFISVSRKETTSVRGNRWPSRALGDLEPFSPVNARGLLVARAFSIAIDPWPPLFSSDSARRRRRGRLAIRWIEVDAAGDAANTGIIFS
jgi:hypothetical protein